MAWDGRPVPRVPVSTLVTAGSPSTSGATQLTLATADIVSNGTSKWEAAWSWYNVVKTATADVFLVHLYDESTLLASWLLNIGVLNGGSGYLRREWTPPAGERTITARLVRASGTGTAQLAANASMLTVRPVGQGG